jgi:hypothetical protein
MKGALRDMVEDIRVFILEEEYSNLLERIHNLTEDISISGPEIVNLLNIIGDHRNRYLPIKVRP